MDSENTQSNNSEDQRNNSKHIGRILGEITVIFVPVFTFLSYLFTYKYQEGFYSYYSIPNMFIEINMTSILENVFYVGIISTIITLSTFFFISIRSGVIIRSAIILLDKFKFILFIVFLFIILLTAFFLRDGDITWGTYGIYFFVAVVLTILSYLGRWIFLKINHGIDIATEHARNSSTSFFAIFLAILSILITYLCFLFSYFGHLNAFQESVYLTSTIDSKKMVLINTYKDSYIFEEVEKLADGKY
ncbi:hypothetical protein GC096_02220 [Paenibacillus sp. LMG 31461]|uniref:Uncharacterized protein n=1 Tax=Paenibacillus plantarum TaxID=2654975 RepID=A0ABX1X380_9BACL|nr:hypothetical protein [Paenibacillus plantarum]NOU62863.1 hypothetical protein [Paenibacillus plantarum]